MSAGGLRLIGKVARRRLDGGALARMEYPPFHVLVAWVDDQPCAIEDACNHAGASLAEGERHGACVACPMHGYVFDLATGRLVAPLGVCDDQRRFLARLVGDDVLVWDPGPPATIVGP